MKKQILKFLVISCLLFWGIKDASAATFIDGITATTGFAPTTITASGNNLALYGFYVSANNNNAFNSFTLTATQSNGTVGTYFAGFKLFRNTTSDNFATASQVTTASFVVNSDNTITITLANPGDSPGKNKYYYYYVEANYTASVYSTFQLALTGYTFNSNPQTTSGDGGTVYNLGTPPVKVTLTSLKTPGSNGLAATPLITTQTNIPIYGFSLAATGTGATANIQSLIFKLATGNNIDDYTSMTLYSCSTNNYTTGTLTSLATYTSTNTGTSSDAYATFPVTITKAQGSATTYYFLVINSISSSVNSNIEEDYSSSTGDPLTSGTQTTGYNYPITSPPYTIAGNTAGISVGPYYYGATGNVLGSFGVSSTAGVGTFTDFTLTSTLAYSTYFSNLTIYSSSNPNYANDLAGTGSPLTPVSFSTSGTTTLTVTLSTAQGIGTTPIYYFIVADLTNGDNLLTANFQFSISAADVNYSGSPMTATNTFPLNGRNYSLRSPIVFGGPYTGGLATVNQLNYDQTQVGILGFSITTPINQTITQINFSANIVPVTSEINTFFSNLKLYTNSTNTAVGATVVSGATVSSLNGKTFNISGLNQVINNTTVYYFIEADFTAPTNFSSTFQLSATSATNSSSVVCNNSAPISGTVYNISPSVTLGAATTTGLSPNPIVVATGTTLGIFSFSVFTGPANTFTKFNLYSTQPTSQYLGTNFSGYALYVNTTANNFAGATLVNGATFSAIASSNTLTISTLSQSIPAGSTYYYFIKAVYNAPSFATTYQLNLASVATASKTYTTGGPINGTVYTLAGPVGVYYWQGGSGGSIAAREAWETAANWLDAHTGTTSTLYPGQGSTTTDIAVFSTAYAPTYFITNIATNKVLSQVIMAINNKNPYTFVLPGGKTFAITNGVILGDPGQVNTIPPPAKPYISQLQLTGNGSYTISGTSYFYNDGSLVAEAPTLFSTNSVVDIYGTANDPAAMLIFDATVTSTTTTWNLTGPGAEIYLDYAGASTLNATNTTINFGGFSSQLYNAGYVTLTGSTVNSTSISDNQYLTGIGSNSGTFTVTGNSIINLGTANNNGNYNAFKCNGGTLTINGNSVVNLKGPNTALNNDYDKIVVGYTGAMGNTPVYGTQAITHLTGATLNLGTPGASDGYNSYINNTDAAYFYLDGSSVINLNGANSELINTSSSNSLGAKGYGLFLAAPTSVINDTTTMPSFIYNQNASDYFTLLSDATGSATIGKLGTGAMVSGLYDVQRYLNGGALYLRNYRLLSSPVNTDNAVSSQYNHIDLSYLGASSTIPYTGTQYYGAFIGGPDASFGGGVHTFTNPLMYLYQENITPGTGYNSSFLSGKNVGIMSLNASNNTIGTSNTASGYGSGSAATAPSVASTSIPRPGYDSSTGVSVPPGNGYIMYYVGNSQNTTPSVPTSPTASNVTASGYINQGQVQLFMWGSRSGNLTDTYGLPGVRLPGITVVGNPYPATLDLQQVWYDNSHAITSSLYQLDKTNQQFDTYDASNHISSTTLSCEYVASGQGFYIHVDSLGSTHQFYFQEDQKAPSVTAPIFPPISNFAVVTPPGQIADNINTTDNNSNSNIIADSFNTPGKSVSGYHVTSTDNLTVNHLNNDQPVHTLMAVQPGDTVAKVLTSIRNLADIHKVARPPATGKKEVQQPKQTPPPHGVTNPANLHLKFVVDSLDYDEVAVAFNKAWSDKYDKNDSYDLDGQLGKVYLSSYTSDDVRTSINLLGDYKGGKRVKLFVKASTAGIFQLQMSDIKNFDVKNYSVFLLDKLKADSLDLTLYKSYNFNYAPGTANDSTRFVLAIEHKPVPYYALLTFAGQKVTPGVQLNWQTKNLGNNTTFILQKLTGNNTYVPIDSLQSAASGEFTYIDQHPALGDNTYRLEQIDALGTITYSAPVTIGYNSTNPNGGLVLYPNPAKTTMTVTLTTASTATTVATADIYNTQGKLVEHKVVNSNTFVHDVSGYDLGVYIIELKNSNGVLVGKSKFVKVE